MRINLLRFLLVFCISLLVLPVAWCQESEGQHKVAPPVVLQWGFVNMPPLASLNDEGIPEGVLAEVMHGTSLYSDIPYIPLEFPNARAIYNLNEQKVNFAIGVKSLVKKPEDFIISSFPVAIMQLNLLWLKTSEDVSSVDDLQGKRLVLLKGYTYGGLRSQLETIASSYIEVETHERAIGALRLNRGKYALTYKAASTYSIPKSEQLGYESLVVADFDVYFILSASVLEATQVMRRLEAGFLLYQQDKNAINGHAIIE